jgi:hypothetical protein
MSDAGFPAPPPLPPPGQAPPPPGYVGYGQAQGAFSPLRNVGGLATAITVLLVILVPLELLNILFTFPARDKAQDYIDGVVSKKEFEDALVGTIAAASGVGLITLATFVLTIIWMYRMAKNLQALNRQGTFGPGWAIAGWFTPPCVLYVVPYLMLRELWRGSQAGNADWRRNPVSPVVHLWWVFFGLLPLVTLVGTRRLTIGSMRNDDAVDAAKNIVDNFGLQIFGGAVPAAAAVLFIVLVRQLTAMHRRLTNGR